MDADLQSRLYPIRIWDKDGARSVDWSGSWVETQACDSPVDRISARPLLGIQKKLLSLLGGPPPNAGQIEECYLLLLCFCSASGNCRFLGILYKLIAFRHSALRALEDVLRWHLSDPVCGSAPHLWHDSLYRIDHHRPAAGGIRPGNNRALEISPEAINTGALQRFGQGRSFRRREGRRNHGPISRWRFDKS